MGYVLTDEQKDLKSMVANFMSKEVKPHLAAIDESGEFPIDIYKQAFDIGLHMLEIPEQFGGSGLDHQTVGILLEEMGYYDPGFAITMLCSALRCV